jgi:hypothetical protein
MFIELCPKHIVAEYLQGGPSTPESSKSEGEVVDAAYRVIQEDGE